MVRITGVDLPKNKQVEIALTYIYGIGRSSARELLDKANIDWSKRTDNLTEEDVKNIRNLIDDEYKVEGDLRKQISMDIKRLMDLGCYRGLRHRRGLPVHGQRTHTNARTRKGPRRAIGGKRR